MKKFGFFLLLALVGSTVSCRKFRAKRQFLGVYECNYKVIEELDSSNPDEQPSYYKDTTGVVNVEVIKDGEDLVLYGIRTPLKEVKRHVQVTQFDEENNIHAVVFYEDSLSYHHQRVDYETIGVYQKRIVVFGPRISE